MSRIKMFGMVLDILVCYIIKYQAIISLKSIYPSVLIIENEYSLLSAKKLSDYVILVLEVLHQKAYGVSRAKPWCCCCN